jgi:hypothetical protein
MDKVFRKASRIQYRYGQIAVPALGACAILLGVGLMGSIGFFAGLGNSIEVNGLYGSSLMLGSDVGTYIIVAILAAALAVVITLICINKSRQRTWSESAGAFEKDENHE